MANYKSTILVSVSLFCFEAVLILFFFRKIRNLFPIPIIEDSEIIGYSQYFGYPFYFDTFIFLAVLLSIPSIIVLAKFLIKHFYK